MIKWGVKLNDNTLINKKRKEAYVLIKIKPKYVEEFCLMLVACKERCNKASKTRNLARIEEVFSVFGPFDFLLELSSQGEEETKNYEKINKTVFKIRETLGNYIDETCTLTKFDLSECLENNSQKMLNKAGSFETKNMEKCELNIFSEILRKERVFAKLNKFREESGIKEAEIKNQWYKNKHLFDIQETCKNYLKNFNAIENLRLEFYKNNRKIILSENAKLSRLDEDHWKIIDEVKRYGIYCTESKLKIYRIISKDVHILLKIKPLYTEEFLIGMTIFKNLCNRSKNLAIIDEVNPIYGQFDFLLELSVGEGEEKEKKINTTILNIRQTLGDYIYETLTIKKFKIPFTKEELENLLEKISGKKYLLDKNGEKIPDEEFDKNPDLIDICNADISSLDELLKKAKSFEFEDFEKKIVTLTNRIEELEKKDKIISGQLVENKR